MSACRISLFVGAFIVAFPTFTAAEPKDLEWKPAAVVAFRNFDDMQVKMDGKVHQALLVGLRPLAKDLGKEEQERIGEQVLKHFASADLFARVVTEEDGRLGLSIDAFSYKRHGFEHAWDPRKYAYCNTGWGAFNFNLYFLERGYTTFLDNVGDNEVADVFHEARRMIDDDLSESLVTVHAIEPRQNVHIVYYDDDFLFLARHHGDHRRPAGNTEPGFFVHSKAHGRWIEIHKISTRDGKFGTSKSDDPEAQKKLVKISVAWDFTPYRDKPHIELPLRTSGSIAFPDRIEYQAKSQRYQLRFFSRLKIDSAETILYIPRADLLAAFEDESAEDDDAAAANKAQSISMMRDLR